MTKIFVWQKHQFMLPYINITELYAFEVQEINLFPTQSALLKHLKL